MQTAQQESRASSLLRWTSGLPVLLIVSWAILYLPRTFVLGLYGDDWWALIEPQHATAPFSLDRLHYFVGLATNYGPRPLMGFTAFLVTSIAGPSPAAIQFLSTLLVLAAALSLRAWLKRLMSVFPRYSGIAADLAVVFWLALPWMLGETAWPDVVHNMGSQILFTEAARWLLARERMTAGLAASVGLAIIASGLIYEAFYFAIFPVVLFYAICGCGPTKNRRDLATLLGICGLAQAIPIAFNRYAAHAHASVSKTFDPAWLKLMRQSLIGLPGMLLNASRESRYLALLAAVLVCAGALMMWFRGRETERRFRVHQIGLVAVGSVIFLVSVMLYSAAGYGLQSVGPDSRTLFAPSLAIALVFFALVSSAFSTGPRIVRAGMLCGAALVIVALAIAQLHRVAEWAYVWQDELRVLRNAPASEISRLPANATVLYIGPTRYKGVAIFEAPWGLTAAVRREPFHQDRRPYQRLPMIYPASGPADWTWDGVTLAQTWNDGELKFPVTELYVWRDGVAGLQQAQPAFHWKASIDGTPAR